MNFKYKNLEITLDEDLEKLQGQVKELNKLYTNLKESSTAYLLEGKTQLIGKNKLEGIRSRKEHTEGIETIVKRFIKIVYETVVDDHVKEENIYKLNLEKELLYSQIIALTHDFGHTPFGHLGERIINKCIQNTEISEEDLKKILARRKDIFGEKYELHQGHDENFNGNISFEHNEQSAKLVYDLIKKYNIDTEKVDINRIVQAILSHSTSRVKEEDIPDDLVAQIVRQADKIEYANSDFEEISEIINLDSIIDKQLKDFIETPKNSRLKEIIQQLIEETAEKGALNDHMTALEKENKLKDTYQNILFLMDKDGKRGLLTGENVERITLMLTKMYEYYLQNPEKIPDKSLYNTTPITEENKPHRIVNEEILAKQDLTIQERIANFICRMDNQKVENEYMQLVKQRVTRGEGYGTEPITQEEIQEVRENFYFQKIKMEKLKGEINGTEYSDDECEANIRLSIEKIIENNLTEKGQQRMVEVRKLHEEENKTDEELNRLIKYYDENPDERNKIDLEKARNAAQKVKDSWEEETR